MNSLTSISAFTFNILPYRLNNLLIWDYQTQCLTLVTLSSLTLMFYLMSSMLFSVIDYTCSYFSSDGEDTNDYEESYEESEEEKDDQGDSNYKAFIPFIKNQAHIKSVSLRCSECRGTKLTFDNNSINCTSCGYRKYIRGDMDSDMESSEDMESADIIKQGFVCADCEQVTCPHCRHAQSVEHYHAH